MARFEHLYATSPLDHPLQTCHMDSPSREIVDAQLGKILVSSRNGEQQL